MRHSKDGILRIPFVIMRSNKKTRDWFRGTMLYARRNPAWGVRIFEVDGRASKGSRVLDFGSQCPDGVISCGLPCRYIRRALEEQGYRNVPVVALLQESRTENAFGTVSFDFGAVAQIACDLFERRGCRHVAYVGAHAPAEVRMSRTLCRTLAAEAAGRGLSFSAVFRKVSSRMGVQITDQPDLSRWLDELPKPCGILAWNDNIGRDVLDLCRFGGITVPGAAYVLAIDDNDLICENSFPTLSSIQVDYEQAAFRAAKLLDDLIFDRKPEARHLSCGVHGVTERASTQDPKGSGRIVTMAREYIEKVACENSTLDQRQIAAHLGVSLRTLQLRFQQSDSARTILQEIQHVRLKRVCWLLKHTGDSISEITYKSGFRSQSRLKAVFVKQFGKNMREYRKSARNPPPPRKKRN